MVFCNKHRLSSIGTVTKDFRQTVSFIWDKWWWQRGFMGLNANCRGKLLEISCYLSRSWRGARILEPLRSQKEATHLLSSHDDPYRQVFISKVNDSCILMILHRTRLLTLIAFNVNALKSIHNYCKQKTFHRPSLLQDDKKVMCSGHQRNVGWPSLCLNKRPARNVDGRVFLCLF